MKERRKSSIPSLLSFKNNPLKSKIKKTYSEGQKTLNAPTQDVRKHSLQNDDLLISVKSVNSIKEADDTSQNINETTENLSAESFENPLKVDKDKSQLHNNTDDTGKYKTDDKTTDNFKESSCDKHVLKHQNNVNSFDDIDNEAKNENQVKKSFKSKESGTPTTPTSPYSKVIMR